MILTVNDNKINQMYRRLFISDIQTNNTSIPLVTVFSHYRYCTLNSWCHWFLV